MREGFVRLESKAPLKTHGSAVLFVGDTRGVRLS